MDGAKGDIWCVVWPGGAAARGRTKFTGKIIRSLSFGEEFEGQEKEDGWVELKDGSWVRIEGKESETVYVARSSSLRKAPQYVVLDGELVRAHQVDPRDPKASEHFPKVVIPQGWRIIELERKDQWIKTQIGWIDTKECPNVKLVDLIPPMGSQPQKFYPFPMVTKPVPRESKMKDLDKKKDKMTQPADPGPAPPSGKPPLPPRRRHHVREHKHIKVDTKKIQKMVDPKGLERNVRKAILGVAACLLRAIDEDQVNWGEGYLKCLGKAFKLRNADVQGVLPLLGKQVPADAYLETIQSLVKKDPDAGPQTELTLLHHSLSSMGYYDARVRVLIRDARSKQGLQWDVFCRYEDIYCQALRQSISDIEKTKEKRKQDWKWRWGKIAGVAVVGGVVTALTAGIAAPIVGASLVAVGGGTALAGAGAMIATGTGAILFGGLVGGYASHVIAYRVNNRIADVKEFEFLPLTDKANPENKNGAMAVVMCIGGWHIEKELAKEEIEEIWGKNVVPYFAPGREVYGIQWETEELQNFGSALSKLVTDHVTSYAIKKVIAATALRVVAAAMAWPLFILELASSIDNAYSVALNRTDKAALILADVLKTRVQGKRPVTLIAFSLGARMVFNALEVLAGTRPPTEKGASDLSDLDSDSELEEKMVARDGKGKVVQDEKAKDGRAKDENTKDKVVRSAKGEDSAAKNKERKMYDNGEDDPRSVVMDVVLCGAGVSADAERWKAVRSVVSGRLVNVYSSADWVLRLLVRANELSLSLAGIQAIQGVEGVENFDASEMVQSHFEYAEQLPNILERIRFSP